MPHQFLIAIMNDLRKAGLVESNRGVDGGYRLARPPSLISFADIIRVTDGPLALLPCASRNFYERCADCDDEQACELRQVMTIVRARVSEVLDYTTLQDAVTGKIDRRAFADALEVD